MDGTDLLTDGYQRIRNLLAGIADGLDEAALVHRPGPDANPIGWLLWHTSRVQDHHVADLIDADQLYIADGWAEAIGLPADPSDIGFGHSSTDVGAVRPNGADVLVGYHRAVADRTLSHLDRWSAADLDAVIDANWDPPVTLGARLLSVIGDSYQHLGQAAYVKGMAGAG